MKITSNKLPSKVICPTSKSYANRALILASLKHEACEVLGLPKATDVLELMSILKELGVKIKSINEGVIIENSFPLCEKTSSAPVLLSGSEGGTTIRFLMPLLSLGKNEYHLPLYGRMGKRPLIQMIKILKGCGVSIFQEEGLLKIKGPITIGDKIRVDCSQTTQFATAMMHLQLIFNFKLEIDSLNSSSKYLEMSNEVLRAFKGTSVYRVPPDFSSLGYFLSYACLNQDILVENIKAIDTLQADSIIIDVLESMGVEVICNENGLFVRKLTIPFNGFQINGGECLDLVPTLVFLSSFAQSRSIFSNVKSLRSKESDRLSGTMEMLSFFNVESQYNARRDELIIYPRKLGKWNAKALEVAFDHRMVMSATLFMKHLGGGDISPSECTFKSFPEFFSFFS